MIFNDTANLSGLIQDCEQRLFGDKGYGQISGNTTRLKRFTALLNRAVDRYITIALGEDGRWQFDDTNQTDYPIGTANLQLGVQDYPLSVNQLIILSVEVLNQAGDTWVQLHEIDEQDFLDKGISLSQYMANTNGPPLQYNKTANSIFLYPAPDYTRANALKVRYQRPGVYFTYDDTTDVPGFAAIHHPFVSLYASWLYAQSMGLKKEASLRADVNAWEQITIPEFYATRSKDLRTKLTPKVRSSR